MRPATRSGGMSTLPQAMISSTARPFPLMVQPAPGEGLRSFIDRLAAHYEVPLATVLSEVGLLKPGPAKKLHGFGIAVDEETLQVFCHVTRLSPPVVRSMLLAHYDGIALDLSNLDLTHPGAFIVQARRQWAYLWGSHFCPLCLDERAGAWKLAWKLPWSFACIRHEVLLLDTCPECGKRSGSGRTDRSLAPVFIEHIPRPGHCWNQQPVGSATLGRGATPCGFHLAGSPYVSLSGVPRLLDAQSRVDMLLEQACTSEAGVPPLARQYFSDLRSLVALTLYCSGVEELGDLPDEAQTAFSAHVTERDALLDERRTLSDHRKGRRQRVFTGAPKSPALMGAILPLATSILDAGTDAEAVRRVRGLADRAVDRTSDRWAVLRYFGFGERLTSIFKAAYAARLQFSRGAGIQSNAGQARGGVVYRFEPRHVPQLLAKEEFENSFVRFFPDVSPNYARRFCSMALVRLCGASTWADAAESLQLPANSNKSLANRVVNVLRKANTYDQFAGELHRVAADLDRQSHRIDYGSLRRALAAFTDFPQEDWERICNSANVHPGKPGARSRYATAWLWAELTCGDWTLAPGLADRNVLSQRGVFRRFRKTALPALARHLLIYGKWLLQTHHDIHGVIVDRPSSPGIQLPHVE